MPRQTFDADGHLVPTPRVRRRRWQFDRNRSPVRRRWAPRLRRWVPHVRNAVICFAAGVIAAEYLPDLPF